jgi:hypothetical protein
MPLTFRPLTPHFLLEGFFRIFLSLKKGMLLKCNSLHHHSSLGSFYTLLCYLHYVNALLDPNSRQVHCNKHPLKIRKEKKRCNFFCFFFSYNYFSLCIKNDFTHFAIHTQIIYAYRSNNLPYRSHKESLGAWVFSFQFLFKELGVSRVCGMGGSNCIYEWMKEKGDKMKEKDS